jgi:hypothetical protein
MQPKTGGGNTTPLFPPTHQISNPIPFLLTDKFTHPANPTLSEERTACVPLTANRSKYGSFGLEKDNVDFCILSTCMIYVAIFKFLPL